MTATPSPTTTAPAGTVTARAFGPRLAALLASAGAILVLAMAPRASAEEPSATTPATPPDAARPRRLPSDPRQPARRRRLRAGGSRARDAARGTGRSRR